MLIGVVLVRRKNIICILLSGFLSLFMCIGMSFDKFKDLTLFIEKPLICLVLYILFTVILFIFIRLLFKKLDNYSGFKDTSKFNFINKIINVLDNKPFLISFCVIILSWIIYIIAFYPILMAPDPSNQVLQFFGIDNPYSHISILLDENMIITNHHPILHTLMLGVCVKLGLLFNNVNLGLFIYTIIQTVILAGTFSYTIKFMKEININKKFRLIIMLIYALVPIFPFYAITPVKDVIFGSLIILYVIMIYRYVNNYSKFSIIKSLILLILLILFRNNGFHVIILSLPLLLFLKYKNRWKLFVVFSITLCFYFSYNKVLLPYFKVTPSSPREMLSIPFQQTARYVLKYGNEVTDKEKEIIDKILIYETLAERYDPEISDPVKNKFNKYSDDKDLNSYFKVWFEQFTKHPVVYLEATLHNTYGYYYPFKTSWVIYSKYKKTLKNNGFDYHFNDMKSLRKSLVAYGSAFPYIPVVGLIANIGFNTWLILFMISYLFYKKKYKEIIIFMPSIVLLLVCIASPVNVYFRYALPNVFAAPVIIGMFYDIIRRKEVRKNEK